MATTDTHKQNAGRGNPEIPVWLQSQFNIYFTTPCYIFCDNEIHFEITPDLCSCGRKKYRMYYGIEEEVTICAECCRKSE